MGRIVSAPHRRDAGGVAPRVIVVRAAGQQLPRLPTGVVVVEDARANRGPSRGCSPACAPWSVPTTPPSCVRDRHAAAPPALRGVSPRCFGPDDDAASRRSAGCAILAGVYRARLTPGVAARLAAGRLSLMGLLDDCGARSLDEAALLDPDLAAADPRLESLFNVNTPGDLAVAAGRRIGPGGRRRPGSPRRRRRPRAARPAPSRPRARSPRESPGRPAASARRDPRRSARARRGRGGWRSRRRAAPTSTNRRPPPGGVGPTGGRPRPPRPGCRAGPG